MTVGVMDPVLVTVEIDQRTDESNMENVIEKETKEDECMDTTDPSKASVIPLFGQLSNVNPTTRVEAVAALVQIVKTAAPDDINYTLDRLIKGLAANKGWSRPGFTVGLISLLNNCDISLDDIFTKMDLFLDKTTDTENQKGIMLGRAFCLAALIKCVNGSEGHHIRIMKELFKILIHREYLRQLTVDLILELMSNSQFSSSNAFRKQLNDSLISIGADINKDPDLALLLFRCKQQGVIDVKKFKTIWGNEEIASLKRLDNLKAIFGAAHNRHPKRHPVIEIIIKSAMNQDLDSFTSFWTNVIEDHLSKQHWEKKYIAIDAISFAFENAKEEHILLFLQGETVRIIRNALSDFGNPARDFLGKKSQQFCASITKRLSSIADDDKFQKIIFVSFLKFFARIKPVCRAILKGLSTSVTTWVVDWWVTYWVKGADEKLDLRLGEIRQTRKWLLDFINTALHFNVKPDGENEAVSEIWTIPLRILITTSLFVVPGKLSKKCSISEVKQIPFFAEFDDSQLTDINNTIDNIVNLNRNIYLNYIYDFCKTCMKEKGVELRTPLSDVAKDIWDRLLLLDERISSHKYSNIVQPLVSQCAVTMLSDDSNASVLNDILNLIEDHELDDDWMPALMELLISFFVIENSTTRNLILSCFRQVNQELNEKAVSVIADAIDPEKDAALEVEDDEAMENGDYDQESETEIDNREKGDGDSESEESSEDEGIDNTEDIDADMEELKKKLAIAMGEHPDEDDDASEDDDDMTDEQMFAMDEAISGAFKSMGKAQREQKAKIELQKMNFKLRVLDLVELYMKRNSKSPHQFLFVIPLMKCCKARKETPLSIKAGRMVSKVMPGGKLCCRTADLSQMIDLCNIMLNDMSKCYSVKYASVLHYTFLYVLRTVRATILNQKEDSQKDILSQINDMISSKLSNFMTQSTSKMSVKFFEDVCHRFPEFVVLSLADLLKFSVSAVNGYRKSVASNLLLKIIKSGSFNKEHQIVLEPNLLQKTLCDVLATSAKTKKENVIATSANLLRFVTRFAERLSENDKKSLANTINQLGLENDLYKNKQELINLSKLALSELGEKSAIRAKSVKEAERQARRNLKRAKAAEKEAKFKSIMEEKKKAGEWVEKSKWKSIERKEAKSKKEKEVKNKQEAKSEEVNTKNNALAETPDEILKKKRKRPKKKNIKKKKENEPANVEGPETEPQTASGCDTGEPDTKKRKNDSESPVKEQEGEAGTTKRRRSKAGDISSNEEVKKTKFSTQEEKNEEIVITETDGVQQQTKREKKQKKKSKETKAAKSDT